MGARRARWSVGSAHGVALCRVGACGGLDPSRADLPGSEQASEGASLAIPRGARPLFLRPCDGAVRGYWRRSDLCGSRCRVHSQPAARAGTGNGRAKRRQEDKQHRPRRTATGGSSLRRGTSRGWRGHCGRRRIMKSAIAARRLLVALADASPAFVAPAQPADGSFLRRLLIAVSTRPPHSNVRRTFRWLAPKPRIRQAADETRFPRARSPSGGTRPRRTCWNRPAIPSSHARLVRSLVRGPRRPAQPWTSLLRGVSLQGAGFRLLVIRAEEGTREQGRPAPPQDQERRVLGSESPGPGRQPAPSRGRRPTRRATTVNRGLRCWP